MNNSVLRLQLLVLSFSCCATVLAQDEPVVDEAAATPVYGIKVMNVFPHDITAFTQGLFFHDGFLYEGTGKNGLSALSKRTVEDATTLQSKSLSRRYFGEGIERVGDKIYQLTWQSHMVFVHDLDTFEQVATHYNPTEGWGLAYDGSSLILSDGTATIAFIDPETFAQQRKITVTLNGNPIRDINELEYINGEIWANVWMTDFILRIDPETGVTNSYIDLTGLSDYTELGSSEAVLNGIAWDKDQERLFVTGKHWANIFEVELFEPSLE